MPKFQDNYPKTEYQRSDFITDTKIIRDLIFAIQQATIMQVFVTTYVPKDENRLRLWSIKIIAVNRRYDCNVN